MFREPSKGVPLTKHQSRSWSIVVKAFRKYRQKCITYDMIMAVWRESEVRLKYTTLDRHIRKFMEIGLLERKRGEKRKVLICMPDTVFSYYTS